jgi:hypothetical protein
VYPVLRVSLYPVFQPCHNRVQRYDFLKKVCIFAMKKNTPTMDNNLKKKIDDIVAEISAVTDLTHKVLILEYMEQQSSYMLWQLQDEIHIDYDSQNV